MSLRSLPASIVVLSLLAGAARAEQDVDKMTAPELLKKSIATLSSQSDYRFEVLADIPSMKMEGAGIFVSPDTWYAKQGQTELYARGKKLLAGETAGGVWKERTDLDKNVAVQVLELVNPKAVIETMLKYARGAKPLDDDTCDRKGEKVVVSQAGGEGNAADAGILVKSPWKVVEVEAPMEEAVKLIELLVRAFPGGMRVPKLDPGKSGVTYRVWILRSSLLPCVVEARYHVTPKSEKDFLPLASLDIRVDLHDHGKKAELNPPAEVKKKLGIR